MRQNMVEVLYYRVANAVYIRIIGLILCPALNFKEALDDWTLGH